MWLRTEVPCYHCIGCRLERCRQWAVRATHEAQLHVHNSFLTLTYEDKKLPAYGSLVKSDLQKFWKRLRKKGHEFRYYACGEYGDLTQRPHYHACVFGFDPVDKVAIGSEGPYPLWQSRYLEEVWQQGAVIVGPLTFQSAAYVASYTLKAKRGFGERGVYRPDEYGELRAVQAPFSACSLRPAIAAAWLDEYLIDAYRKDHVLVNGRKQKPPQMYDRRLKKVDQRRYEAVKEERRKKKIEEPIDLVAHETITRARIRPKEKA